MVSFTRFEDDFPFVKQNGSQEQSKSHETPLSGFETLVYLLCDSTKINGTYGGLSCTDDDEQSLLDTLILSKWEERSSLGRLSYDVTSCETKIVGGKKLIAQLNEEWNSNFFKQFEKKAFEPSSGIFKPSYIKNHQEEILLCVTTGEREGSVLVPLTAAPQDGILIIVNENPIEYGHIFLAPYCLHRMSLSIGGALRLVAQIADEVNNPSFQMFYDYFSATNADRTYFQASYFANPLPVELLPAMPVHGIPPLDGVHIMEVSDYPLNALIFVSRDLNKLADIVGEICSVLQHRNTVFNLLISDRGTKMFLFPQVHLPVTGRHLHAWECGGYFIYGKSSDFDSTSEMEISKKLASVSLDAEGFESLKQLCRATTAKIS